MPVPGHYTQSNEIRTSGEGFCHCYIFKAFQVASCKERSRATALVASHSCLLCSSGPLLECRDDEILCFQVDVLSIKIGNLNPSLSAALCEPLCLTNDNSLHKDRFCRGEN